MSTKSWMERKRITLNKLDPNGKPVQTSITVKDFIEMYNVQNSVFTRTTEYTQILLGQLFIENPDSPFFKKCDPQLLVYAKKRAEEIKKDPAKGILKFVEPKKKEEPKKDSENNTVPFKKEEAPKKKDEKIEDVTPEIVDENKDEESF